MSGLRRLLVALLLAVALAPAAYAAPKPDPRRAQLVERLAAQARAAFEAGDNDRAADLYLGAWKQDPTQTALVFNAARALHLGRRFDRAEELYRQFIELPTADAALVAKAKAYLGEIQLARGEERADEAQRLGRLGRHAECAAAWRDAYRYAPSRPTYLLRAARAARLTADPQSARADYRAYLQVAAPGSERDEAQRELDLLEKPSEPAEPPKAATPAHAEVPLAPPATPTQAPPVPPAVSIPLQSWVVAGLLGGELALGAGADGLAMVAELVLGLQNRGGMGGRLWLRGGAVLSQPTGNALAIGLGATSELAVATLAIGPEFVIANAVRDQPCVPMGGTAATATCPVTSATDPVVRLRLRAERPFSEHIGLAVDVFAGADDKHWQPQAGLAVGLQLRPW